MSSGGVFKIIANDGKADSLIMATDVLNKRIKAIMCERHNSGLADTTPTLADIEKTHILFVNAHYKPFAAIAFEYAKVRPSGQSSWGAQVQFSIPSYGEFFNDMVANVECGSVSCIPGTIPAFPAAITNTDVVTTADAQISTSSNAATHTYTTYTQKYVNSAGETLSVGSAATNFVRYCEYPGEMMFREVKFEVNGNPLDSYYHEATMFYRKLWVTHDKEIGWARMMGQEVPVEGYSTLASVAGKSNFTAPIAGLLDRNGARALGAPMSANVTTRKLVHVVHGPQTPQAVQPELHLWIPLLFWFNKDVRLAIPSVSIPFGQRYITVTLENQANIVYPAPGDVYLRVITERHIDADVDPLTTGTKNAKLVTAVETQISQEPVLLANSTINPAQSINVMLYVNNLFVTPEVHDIYIKRIGFSLIRVHRMQKTAINTAVSSTLLSQLKWPTEMIYLGLIPDHNNRNENPNKYRDWHNLTRITDEVLNQSAYSISGTKIDDTAIWGAGSGTKYSSCQSTTEQVIVPIQTPTVKNIAVDVQANQIQEAFDGEFFRDYTTWYYGQQLLRTPRDPGAYMINFAIYPGAYQPSGHLNISRAREFYVNITAADFVGQSEPCTLIIIAIAINFLLISDGSCVLRFSS